MKESVNHLKVIIPYTVDASLYAMEHKDRYLTARTDYISGYIHAIEELEKLGKS